MTKKKLLTSALSLILALMFILLSFTGCKKSTEGISTAPTKEENKEADIFSSIFKEEAVPSLYITTENNFEVRTKSYFDANIRLTLNERYAEYSSTYTDEDGGGMKIKCRGNSTFTKPEMQAKNKWSYKIKLNNKANLLGMGESRHWYLLANWNDVSAMRNKLAYDFAGSLGMTYTQSTWVVVYYNGEYRGLYQLCESIRVGEGRVETFDWDSYIDGVADKYALSNGFTDEYRLFLRKSLKKNLAWISGDPAIFEITETIYNKKLQTYYDKVISSEEIDVSGYFDRSQIDFTSGYLIEYDGRLDTDTTSWRTKQGLPAVPSNLEYLETNKEMYNYVKTLIQDFENAVYAPNFHNSKGKHYSEYLDVNSLIDFWLVWTMFNNIEFGYLSIFYYIDNGKIIFGPCWDFDFASGNIVTLDQTWMRPDRWNADRGDRWGADFGAGWFRQIFKDPYFTSLAQERYYSIRPLLDDMMQSFDVYHFYIAEEAARCYERNGPRTNKYLNNFNNGKSYDFENDFKHLKNWLTEHIQWLDKNLSPQCPNVDGGGNDDSKNITLTLTNDANTLTKTDKIVSYGIQSYYTMNSNSAKGKLTLKAVTTKSNSKKASLYLNGTRLVGTQSISSGKAISYTLNTDDLDLTPSAVNVLYLVIQDREGKRIDGDTIYIRIYDVDPPKDSEAAIAFGDYTNVVIAEKGSSVSAPAINEKKVGFKATGWTAGDQKVYKTGEKIPVSENAFYYVRWERLDMNSFMVIPPN